VVIAMVPAVVADEATAAAVGAVEPVAPVIVTVSPFWIPAPASVKLVVAAWATKDPVLELIESGFATTEMALASVTVPLESVTVTE
jgi:hypothetical protein